MKKLALLLAVVVMSGCSTVPVERKFPNVPKELTESCPDLKQTQSTNKLSEVLTIVVENYGQYHECKVKADSWMEWYKTQKQIFDSVK
jgi:hypothetical protein